MMLSVTFKQYFIYNMVVSFIGEGKPRKKTSACACCKSLTNFIT